MNYSFELLPFNTCKFFPICKLLKYTLLLNGGFNRCFRKRPPENLLNFWSRKNLRSKKHEDLAGEWMKYTWIIGDQSGNESRPFIPVFDRRLVLYSCLSICNIWQPRNRQLLQIVKNRSACVCDFWQPSVIFCHSLFIIEISSRLKIKHLHIVSHYYIWKIVDYYTRFK